jgi:hypothetical protein
MRTSRAAHLLGLLALSLLLAACQGYTEVGSQTKSRQNMKGGELSAKASKANGTIRNEIDVEDYPDVVLEANVTLSVGKGTFQIELLGEDGEVTLALKAGEGETVRGYGQMVPDSFGKAGFRVTAVEAEQVAYTIEYTFR